MHVYKCVGTYSHKEKSRNWRFEVELLEKFHRIAQEGDVSDPCSACHQLLTYTFNHEQTG